MKMIMKRFHITVTSVNMSFNKDRILIKMLSLSLFILTAISR